MSRNYGTQFIWALHAFTPIDQKSKQILKKKHTQTHNTHTVLPNNEIRLVSHALMDNELRGSKVIELSEEQSTCEEIPDSVWTNKEETFKLKFRVKNKNNINKINIK
jgi:hypothetical protein